MFDIGFRFSKPLELVEEDRISTVATILQQDLSYRPK